ncbi:MAG TPA: hypothetical protein VIY53_18070 [Acidobacteriaceae bacterium]
MIPLIVLLVFFAALRCAGLLGMTALNNADLPLRIALCLMFLVTASAHWGRGRADLIRMVPPAMPRAALLVTVTDVLEILGAAGLLIPATASAAAACLACFSWRSFLRTSAPPASISPSLAVPRPASPCEPRSRPSSWRLSSH